LPSLGFWDSIAVATELIAMGMQDNSISSRNLQGLAIQSGEHSRRSAIKVHLEQLLILYDPTDDCSISVDGIEPVGVQPGFQNPLMIANDRIWSSANPVEGSKAEDTIDPVWLRKIIRMRKLRNRFFGKHLFADPAWDMLLDLAMAHSEGRPLCVSSLGYGSGIPATTSLRWIGQLVKDDLIERVHDEKDKRRTFVRLSANGLAALKRFFREIGSDASAMV
jgi:DNA-binding MarR family transcriptional regulator